MVRLPSNGALYWQRFLRLTWLVSRLVWTVLRSYMRGVAKLRPLQHFDLGGA